MRTHWSRCAPDAARQLAEHLTPADSGPSRTGVKFSSAWGTRDDLDTTLVEPNPAAETSADTSIDRGGVNRHPIRYVRLRQDASVDDVPRLDEGQAGG
ncbi:hypothetical protein OV450_8531 [Actinobacteria bacterium OV450]|nr:hypothetical protein OV450_8531 [Actinobacteria bacterium OV450]